MDEEASDAYNQFKAFLKAYFIKKAEGNVDAESFKENIFENIRSHLRQLLPSLSLTEATWIKIYFTDAFIFHLNVGLGRPNVPTPLESTPIAVLADEGEMQPSQEKIIQTHSQRRAASDPSSEAIAQEDTPIIPIDPIQRRKTVPAMQSTPLSISTVAANALVVIEERTEEDNFIADIFSQINASPIPEISPPSPLSRNQPEKHFPINLERAEVPFLRAFANVQKDQQLPETKVRTTPKRTRSKPPAVVIKPIVRSAKQKKKKMDFEDICRIRQKKKSQAQIQKAQESYLYFPLMPGKTRNMIQRIMNNTIIPQGERGYIPMERVINMSNVLRAHASQRQISVEQPVQLSQLSSTRSPITPQALLRTSQLQPFTPFRGETSRHSPRTDIQPVSNLTTRPLLRQQPLLPIPERDSSIHIPHSPLPVDIPLDNSIINIPPLPESLSSIPFDLNENLGSHSSNVIRTVPEDVEMVVEHPQMYQDSSTIPNQLESLPLNSSLLNIHPLPENLPLIPFAIVGEQSSSIPAAILEDFEMIDHPLNQQELPPHLGNMPSEAMEIGENITPQLELPRIVPEDIEMLEPHTSHGVVSNINESQSQTLYPDEVLRTDTAKNNPRLSWFEFLRPRLNIIEYPSNVEPRRRRKRRRRRTLEERNVRPRVELPVIPISPARNNPTIEEANLTEKETNFLELPAENNLPNLSSSPLPDPQYSQFHFGDNQQITQTPYRDGVESQLRKYLELIKEASRKDDFTNWVRFDPYLFKEDDNFEIYTYIFKKIIKDDYVAMDTLYEQGTTRLEAAKGFRLILELKAMGLIDVEAIETRIVGFMIKSSGY